MSSSEKLYEVSEKLTRLHVKSEFLMKKNGTATSELIAVAYKVKIASQRLERLALDVLSTVDSEEEVFGEFD